MIKNINKTIITAILSLLVINGATTSLAYTKGSNDLNSSGIATACNYQIDMYTTAKNGLNLRTSPTVSSNNKILKIPFGTKITTLTPVVKGWVKIVIHDENNPAKWQDGYVSAKYLSKKDPTTKTTGIYKVTANTLNMRSKANTSSTVVGKLKKGDSFEIIQSQKAVFANNYYFRKVKITSSKTVSNIGKTGWVAVKYTNAPIK